MLKEFKNVSVNYEGDAVIELNRKKYKIHDCIAGEDILVQTDGKYPVLAKVTKPSEYRISNGCPHQKECGGCQFMHMRYDYEITCKKNYLNDLFKHLKLRNIEMIASFEELHYRNKCQMTYRLSKNKNLVCGFYEEHSHKIIPVENCFLQAKPANQLIKEVNAILKKHKITPYDEATKQGVLRHIFIRYGFQTKEIMLVLVTNGEMFPGRNNVVKDLLKLPMPITTIVQNYNKRDTSIVLGQRQKILYGTGYITEKIANYIFRISPNSFFQVNSLGVKRLYDQALQQANFNKSDVVLDAYCGVGTISIFMASSVCRVIGVELNKKAIEDAIINAKLNRITNIEFIADDATNYITHAAKNKEKIDVIIMDPPREGSTRQFIDAIGYLKPRTVIYISCNPLTLKRDLYDFFNNGYQVQSMTGVDMFSRTSHIECVCSLSLKTAENDKK